MRVVINNLAWLDRAGVDEVTLHILRNDLTIVPRATSSFNADPEPIRLYALTPKWIGVPRAYYEEKKKSLGLAVDEKYEIAQGRPLSSQSNLITLRAEDQEPDVTKFVDLLREKKYGIFEAYTAYGKSFCGIEIIQRINRNTLFIIHREALMNQWIEEIGKMAPDLKIGIVRGKSIDYVGKDITFAMVQSLMNDEGDKLPKEFWSHFGMVMVDECLDGDTYVATQGGQKKIKDIVVGDMVLSPEGKHVRVTKVSSKKDFARKYLFKSGRYLIASDNHPVVTRTCRGVKHFRPHLSIRETQEISTVSNVEMFECRLPKEFDLEEYFVGWFIGDGFIDEYQVRFMFRKQEKIAVFRELLLELGMNFKESVNIRGDTSFVLRGDVFHLLEKYGIHRGEKQKNYKVVPELLFAKCSSSFLAGIYDADGHVNQTSIEFDSADEGIADSVFMMLCNLGINCNRFSYKKEKVNHRDCQRIMICSFNSLKYFREIIGFRVPKKLNALNKLIDKPRQVIHNRNCDPVINKVDIGIIDLYDITIDSPDHLFIANGLLVHNCHSFGAEKFGSVAPRFSAEYMCGTSGTIYRLDNCEKVFKSVLGDVLVKANTINRVHPKIYVRIPPSSGKFVSPSMEKPQLISMLTRDMGRNKFIAEDTVKAVKAGRYPIVMSERIELLENIDYWIKKLDKTVTTGYYIGGKKEEELKIAAAQAVVLTTVQMMKEGINLPIRDTLMLVTPQSLVEQAVGRVCRKLPGKKTPFVLDYVDVDIKKFKGSFVSRYKLYKSLGWEVNGANKVGL